MGLDFILGMKLAEAQEYLSRIKCKIKKVEKTRPPFTTKLGAAPVERIVYYHCTSAGEIELIIADFRA